MITGRSPWDPNKYSMNKNKAFSVNTWTYVCVFLCKKKCTLSMSNTRKTNCTVNLFVSAQEIHILFFYFFLPLRPFKNFILPRGQPYHNVFISESSRVSPQGPWDHLHAENMKYDLWKTRRQPQPSYTPTTKPNNPYGLHSNGRGSESWLWSID